MGSHIQLTSSLDEGTKFDIKLRMEVPLNVIKASGSSSNHNPQPSILVNENKALILIESDFYALAIQEKLKFNGIKGDALKSIESAKKAL